MFITATPVPLLIYQQHPNLFHSQSHILIEVEQLVNLVVYQYKLKKHARAINRNRLIFPELFYQQLLCSLYRYLSVYQANYIYSEQYDALLYACRQVGIIDDFEGMAYVYPADLYQMYALVEHIALYSKTVAFTRKVGDRAQRQKENHQRIVAFAQAMHQQYARLLVCRVDLSYLHSHQHLVRIDTMMQHLQQLRKLISYRQGLFEHLKDYIWAIEHGVDKGYHTHLMLYFDGRCHQRGWYMAQQIGELWQSIAGESGSYFNCHNPAAKANYLAMGTYGLDMIYRHEQQACDNAVYVASYLARLDKTDQFLRCKPKYAHAMGMATIN